jgi:Rrf2 family protein
MSEGVEWAAHCCVVMVWAGGEPVSATRLAGYYRLPPAYLNKQLQALVRAGLVISLPGPRGGFRLARSPDRITLWDVVAAIEGGGETFHCTEIRARSGGAVRDRKFGSPCAIAVAMHDAERAWRDELAARTVADFVASAEREAPGAPERVRTWLETAET